MGAIQNKTGPARGPFFDGESVTRPCWSCEHDGDDLYNCSNCDKIQHFLKDNDYFTWFGFDHSLSIDQDALEKQYHTLSRKFHPDYFQQRTPEEQTISLENTAQLTQAYRILKDPKKRVRYLIGLIEGDKPMEAEAPAELFEDIFEIQERLETLENIRAEDAGQEAVRQELKNDLEKMQAYHDKEDVQLNRLAVEWDSLEKSRNKPTFSDEQKAHLQRMKKILSHEGYLDRIIQNIQSALEKNK